MRVWNPVTTKELCGVSRRGRTYLARILYIGLVSAAIGLATHGILSSRDSLSVSELAQLGRRIYSAFLPVQVLFIVLAAVVSSSGMIAREVQKGTLGVLLSSGVSVWQIAQGKWRAVMFQVGTLLLSGAPILAVCAYLGAVSTLQMAGTLAATLALMALSAALGLFSSVMHRSTTRAALATVMLLLLFIAFPALIIAFAGIDGFVVLTYVHPFYSLLGTVPGAGDSTQYGWIVSTLLTLLAVRYVLQSTAGHILNREAVQPKPPQVEYPDDTGLMFTHARQRYGPVWDDHPMLWKDLVTRASGKISHSAGCGAYILIAGLFVLFGTLAVGAPFEAIAVPGTLILILTIIYGSLLFLRDKDGRCWEVLLTTPARPSTIVWSKLISGVVAPEAWPVHILLALLLLITGLRAGPVAGLAIAFSVLLFLAFAYVVSAAASLFARTPYGAIVGVFGTFALILVVLPLLCTEVLPRSPGPWAFPGVLTRITNPVEFLHDAPLRSGIFFGYCAVYGLATATVIGSMILRTRRL